jgi:3-hydroxyacyl-CoA dehydrogenase/enoyl-CoA hydratase/3-hydroxybutyryl-CoA epimerase
MPQGLDLEARIVGELVPTRTSKNLMWLFKSQSALKKDAGGIVALPRKIRRAAVLGAGIMGGGIAQLIADKGIPVRLRDLRGDALLAALRHASKIWREQVDRKRLSSREMRQRLGFIAPTLDETGLARVDIVLEAVVENLEVKQKVLAALEERIGARAVFASNTSTIPISDIAARAVRPERVVGMQFFNPVHRMPLVEVIAGQRSSPEAVSTVHAFALELGKVPVVVRDAPGFLVNRILMLYFNEALRFLVEGVGIEHADRSMQAFGMPVGPFALMDEIGLDTGQHAATVLEGAFGKRIGAATPILQAIVAGGRLGKKNGKGFYHYNGGSRARPDAAVPKLAGAAPALQLPFETLQERMVLAMVNEAAICLEDGVVREPRDVDVAMVYGTGFPPFRGGLLRFADSIGPAVLVDRLSRLADAHGERFRPAGMLRDMVREERRFYPA